MEHKCSENTLKAKPVERLSRFSIIVFLDPGWRWKKGDTNTRNYLVNKHFFVRRLEATEKKKTLLLQKLNTSNGRTG